MTANNSTDTLAPDNDEETFRELMEKSAPVPDDNRPRAAQQTPSARRSESYRLSGAPPTMESTEDEYMHPGLQHKEMRRLKQGKFSIGNGNRIDLHGLTRDKAYQSFHAFLDDCLNKHTRYAAVICGKGIHSPTGRPVLKSAVRSWLVEHGDVLAYCPAQPRDGGDGALYLLLKNKHTPC